MPGPFVLGFDTSASACDVALLQGAHIVAHRCETMAKGQAERLLSLCDALLTDADISWHHLAAIGVGVGPGNFTGIRISVAAARGLALGLGVPAVGVSAFDALRFGASGQGLTSVDARRNQVYVQAFAGDALDGPPRLMDRAALHEEQAQIIGVGGLEPALPAAIAIARLALSRHTTPQPRPAPVYLRPADAAPAKDSAPTLLS